MKILYLLLLVLVGQQAFAEVSAARRHVVIINGATDQIFANYLFSVQNQASEPVQADIPVMMAKEKQDWMQEEGIKSEEVKLGNGEGSDVILSKRFPPGDTLVGFRFNAPAAYGSGTLTFKAPFPLGEFLLMVPRNTFKLAAEGMEWKPNQNFVGRRFDILEKKNVEAGSTLVVTVSGLPEGRGRFWLVGSVFGGLIFLLGGFFTWRFRPNISESEDLVIEGSDA